MAASAKPSSSSRYSSYYDSRSSTSSHFSDPSSSSEFNLNHKSSSSRAIVKAKPFDIAPNTRNKTHVQPNLTTMVKKLMEKKPKVGNNHAGLIVPSDLIAQDLKKNSNARRVTGLSALQNKLFGKGKGKGMGSSEKKEVKKALTEVKGNTRTLAMVLRSERELLSMNKEQEMEIAELKLMLDEKNKEVEKLKDLCLKQREEIKSLKSAILFPDVMNSQLQELLEKQGSELKQAKQVIPALQMQVTSLTGQLQSLAEDLAEVKADKYSAKACNGSSPRTPTHAREDASNSWEISSEDLTTPGSLDDLLLKDLNPCLTPYNAKSRSRDFEGMGSGSLHEESVSEDDTRVYPEMDFSSYGGKLSRSSDSCHNPNKRSVTTKAGRRSDEVKLTYGGRRNHKLT